MIKKLIRKMQTAAGGPLRIKFTPEQIALFKSYATRVPGTNNSGGDRYREEGVLALLNLEQEAKRKEEEIKSRMEMHPTLKRKTTTTEKIRGKKDEYELKPQIVGMSGADPLLSFYVGGVGLNGIGALAKTGLWNVAKYAPKTLLGNWGRGYFIGNTFKNSFNGSIPTLASQATSLLYQPAKLNESGLTSLKFFERGPAKLTEAERKGFSKGKEYYTKELNESFLKQINDFAEKYGYTGLKEGNYTSKQLNAYARALIDRHNKFYRGVVLPIGEDLNLVKNVLGNKATNELILLHVATHSRGKDINPELYMSPTTNAFSYGASGKTAIISRPYKLGKDRTKWFDEGDFNIVETGTVNPKSYNNFLGIVYPWDSPRFLIYDPFIGKKIIPENYRHLTSLDIAGGEGYYEYVPNPYVQNELISINNPMIFRLWVESPTLETLSKKTPDIPWQLSKIIVEKQGGKMNILEFLKKGSGIHIKKKNRGKFTSYCGGKVTDECIRKAKTSGNPTLVKRATFAANARKWKHKKGGKAFVEGVNVLDSNPKAYKYVKKAQQGGNINWGQLISGVASSALSTYALNQLLKALKELEVSELKGTFEEMRNLLVSDALEKLNQLRELWKLDYLNGTTLDRSFESNAVYLSLKNNLTNNATTEAKNKYENLKKGIDAKYKSLITNNWMNFGTNLMLTGMGIAGLYLSNKGTTNAAPSTTPTTTGSSIYKLDSFWEKPYLTPNNTSIM